MTDSPLHPVRRRCAAALAAVAIAGASTAFLAVVRAQPKAAAGGTAVEELARQFRQPPSDARIMMRWWWFGAAVTRAELGRELEAMRYAGIGGVEVQPVYPVTLDDPSRGIATLPYLSDGFLDAVRFAAARARDLGLRFDLTLGSGWPYGGPVVRAGDAAGHLRVERVALPAGGGRVMAPDVGAGERLLAAFLVGKSGARELPAFADGAADVTPDGPDPASVLFFVASRTGQVVKRPAVNAEGFVVNHYDEAALQRYLAGVGAPLLAAVGPVPPYAVFCDSFEVYESDWTDDFLAEFQRRRGYDLKPHLPDLVAGGENGAAVRYDWGLTLNELVNDRFLSPLQAWASRNGTRLRAQAYGIPPASIWSNSIADLPEGEGSQWKGVSAARWAASAAHLFGRPVVSSETWTWLHSPSFRATPLDMKAEADLHFLQGINQLVGHGWPYSPDAAGYPGWRFYAAGAFNDRNPWWTVMPDVAAYMQRVSFLLRQGSPANDVALLLPIDDAWAAFEPGKVGSLMDALNRRVGPAVVGRVLEAGYGLDFVDDQVLRARARVDGNALVVGSARYRAVVLPGIERMSVETARLLESFAAAGGVVVATRRAPDRSPGFLDAAAGDRAVREIVRRLFEAPGARGVVAADEEQAGAAVASRLAPDVRLAPASPRIGFVHRRLDAAEVYFVANTGNVPVRVEATFQTKHAVARAFDPVTGGNSPIASRDAAGGGVTVTLDLAPYGSTAIVFSGGQASRPPRRPAGRQRPPAVPLVVDLSSGWRVAFRSAAPGGTAPAPAALDTLRSWTELAGARYFSGVGTYEREVDVTPSMLSKGKRVLLDLGDTVPTSPAAPNARQRAWVDAPVRDAAIVFVNGRRAGASWCPPFALDVTAALHAGRNTIRIEVANTAINHMAGRALPDYRLLNRRYGVRFEPQDMDQVVPAVSGLVGRIRLVVS